MGFSNLPATRWDRLLAVLEEIDPSLGARASQIIENKKKLKLSDVEFFYYLLVYYQDSSSQILREALNVGVLTYTWLEWLKKVTERSKNWYKKQGGSDGYARIRIAPRPSDIPVKGTEASTDPGVASTKRRWSCPSSSALLTQPSKEERSHEEGVLELPSSTSVAASSLYSHCTTAEELEWKFCHLFPSLQSKHSYPEHLSAMFSSTIWSSPSSSRSLWNENEPSREDHQNTSKNINIGKQSVASDFSSLLPTSKAVVRSLSSNTKGERSGEERSPPMAIAVGAVWESHPASAGRTSRSVWGSLAAADEGNPPAEDSPPLFRGRSTSHRPSPLLSSPAGVKSRLACGLADSGAAMSTNDRTKVKEEDIPATTKGWEYDGEGSSRVKRNGLPSFPTATPANRSSSTPLPSRRIMKNTWKRTLFSLVSGHRGTREKKPVCVTPGGTWMASGDCHDEGLHRLSRILADEPTPAPCAATATELEHGEASGHLSTAHSSSSRPSESVWHRNHLGASPALFPAFSLGERCQDEKANDEGNQKGGRNTSVNVDPVTVLHHLLYQDTGESILEPLRSGEFLCQLIVDILELRGELNPSLFSRSLQRKGSSLSSVCATSATTTATSHSKVGLNPLEDDQEEGKRGSYLNRRKNCSFLKDGRNPNALSSSSSFSVHKVALPTSSSISPAAASSCGLSDVSSPCGELKDEILEEPAPCTLPFSPLLGKRVETQRATTAVAPTPHTVISMPEGAVPLRSCTIFGRRGSPSYGVISYSRASPPRPILEKKQGPLKVVWSVREKADFFLEALNKLCSVLQGSTFPFHHTSSSFFFDPKKFNPGGATIPHRTLNVLRTEEELLGLQRLHWLAIALYEIYHDASVVPPPSPVSYMLLGRAVDITAADKEEVGVQVASMISCLPHQIQMEIQLKENVLYCTRNRACLASFSSSPLQHMENEGTRRRRKEKGPAKTSGKTLRMSSWKSGTVEHKAVSSPTKESKIFYPCVMVCEQVYAFLEKEGLFVPLAMVMKGLLERWEGLPWTFGTDVVTSKRLQELGLSNGESAVSPMRGTSSLSHLLPNSFRKKTDSRCDLSQDFSSWAMPRAPSVSGGVREIRKREEKGVNGRTSSASLFSFSSSISTGVSRRATKTQEHRKKRGEERRREENSHIFGEIFLKTPLSSRSSSLTSSEITFCSRTGGAVNVKGQHSSFLLHHSVLIPQSSTVNGVPQVVETRQAGVAVHAERKENEQRRVHSDEPKDAHLEGVPSGPRNDILKREDTEGKKARTTDRKTEHAWAPHPGVITRSTGSGKTEGKAGPQKEVNVHTLPSSVRKGRGVVKASTEDKSTTRLAEKTLCFSKKEGRKLSELREEKNQMGKTSLSFSSSIPKGSAAGLSEVPSGYKGNRTRRSGSGGERLADHRVGPQGKGRQGLSSSLHSPSSSSLAGVPRAGTAGNISTFNRKSKTGENEECRDGSTMNEGLKKSPAQRKDDTSSPTRKPLPNTTTARTPINRTPAGAADAEGRKSASVTNRSIPVTRQDTAKRRKTEVSAAASMEEGKQILTSTLSPSTASPPPRHSPSGDFSAIIVCESVDRQIEVSSHHFRISGNLIGKGAFGAVFKALNLETGEIVAVKQSRFSLESGSQQQLNWKEFQLWSRLPRHSNVIQFYGASIDQETHQILLVLEYAGGGNILSLYKKYAPMSKTLFLKHAKDIALGLIHLHDHSVLHGDVKPENVLIRSDGSVAISDFGCSRVLYHLHYTRHRTSGGGKGQSEKTVTFSLSSLGQKMKATGRTGSLLSGVIGGVSSSVGIPQGDGEEAVLTGTIPYLSPELMSGKVGLASDVWAYACTMIYLWTGEKPWGKSFPGYCEGEGIALLYYLSSTESAIPYTKTQLARTPKWLQSVASRALERDPEKRCSMREVLTILTNAS